jgi:plastocyanin
MSILGRSVSLKAIGAMALLMIFVTLIPALSGTPNREIVLVVKGMSFHLENDPLTPNPTLNVKAGERVRVVVHNQDRGMTHNFAVPALDVDMNPMRWSESGDIVFVAPDVPGTYEYVCGPHQLMMRGTIRVY